MKKNNSHKTLILTIIAGAVVVVVVMLTLIFALIDFIKDSAYSERKTYLNNIVELSASSTYDTIESYQVYTNFLEENVSCNTNPSENIYSYIASLNNSINISDIELLLIDENGIWYGNNTTKGKVMETQYYTSSSAKKVIYLKDDEKYENGVLTIRNKLDSPVVFSDEKGTINIEYCAISVNTLSLDLNETVDMGEHINSFIVDSTGLMLYKRFGISKLISGSNVLEKIYRVKLIHGEEANDLVDSFKSGKTTVFEFKIDNESYFMCSAKLGIEDWLVTYIIPTSQLAAGSYIDTITMYIVFIIAIFSLALFGFINLIIISFNNRKTIKKEQEANRFLEQASNAKGQFLSNMSHDIRTPINGIMGMAQIGLNEEIDNPKLRDCLLKIDNASKHLLSLVNDILDMSSIENNKMVITPKPVDILKTVENVGSMLSVQADGKNITMDFDFTDVIHPYILCDELHLKQILINLLGNAVKYTPRNGHIWFTFYEETSGETFSKYYFIIKDNGIGMKEDFLTKIFNPFTQEDGGARTEQKGSGLGLAITKNLVELMNGTIDVESVYNQGSTFSVCIPFSYCSSDQIEKEFDIKYAIEDVRVLLVEDNELNIEIAKELLEANGAVVTVCENGKEAVDKFNSTPSHTFDVILMDIMMPIMDGYEATRQIRASENLDATTIPIFAMTANAFSEDVEKSKVAGMNEHLSKPIEIDKVLKMISKYVKRGNKE